LHPRRSAAARAAYIDPDRHNARESGVGVMVQCDGGHWLVVDDRLSGTVVRCAACKRLVCVPPMAILLPESAVAPPRHANHVAPVNQTPPVGFEPGYSPWSDVPPPVGASRQSTSSQSTVELKSLRPPPWSLENRALPLGRRVPPRRSAAVREDPPEAILPGPPPDGDSHIPMAVLLPEVSHSLPVAPPRIAQQQPEPAATGVSPPDGPTAGWAVGSTEANAEAAIPPPVVVEGAVVEGSVVEGAADGNEPFEASASARVAGGRWRRRRSVSRRMSTPTIVPPDAYQAEQRWITLVKYLAIGLTAAVLFSLLPVLVKGSLNLAIAPPWARVALLVSALQAAYVLWLLATPDWAALRVLTYVFAAVAALYALGGALALAAPVDKLSWLGLDEVQTAARSWCGAVMAVMMLASYVCGRCAARWRLACQQQLAARRRSI